MISFPTFCNHPTVQTMIKCPLGLMKLITCTSGVHCLQFETMDNLESYKMETSVSIDTSIENLPNPTIQVIDWLKTYFQHPKQISNMEMPEFCFLPPGGRRDRFSDRVLDELVNVKLGESISYAELATRAGNAKASRAVGQTMRSNPVCVLIPCHRVILKSGQIGHYGGGTKDDVKAWLLKHEAENS